MPPPNWIQLCLDQAICTIGDIPNPCEFCTKKILSLTSEMPKPCKGIRSIIPILELHICAILAHSVIYLEYLGVRRRNDANPTTARG